jgi:hypothetical protein
LRDSTIPEEQWISFFNRFSHEHVGWPVTIEVIDARAGPERLAQELPFQGISFDPAGSRPCTIQVGAGDQPSASLAHVIDLPLHIRLADAEDGSAGTVQIEPARGPITLVHYHRPTASA